MASGVKQFIDKLRYLFTPREKFQFAGIAVLMTVSALAELLGVGVLVAVVAIFLNPDIFESNRYLHPYFVWTGLSYNTFIILHLSLIGIGLVLKNVFALWVVYLQSCFIYRKQCVLAVRLYQTYLLAPYHFSQNSSLADRNSSIARVRQICTGTLLPVMQVVADGVMTAILTLTMFFFLPFISLFCISSMLLAAWLIYYVMRKLNFKIGQRVQQTFFVNQNFQHSGFAGLKAIKAVCKEYFFIRRFAESEQKMDRDHGLLYTLGQVPRLVLDSVTILVLILIFFGMLLHGDSSHTILLTYSLLLAVAARILPALSRCNYNLTLIRQHQYLFQELFDQITSIEPENTGASEVPLTLDDSLVLKDLSFSYDGSRKIISQLNLELKANRSLGIVGKTGCGKSTLEDLILGLLTPTSGAILTDGVNIFDNLKAWRNMIGYVPQHIFILEATIRENVAFAIPEAEIDDARVMESLRLAQIWDMVEKMPGGIYAELSDNGNNLSGGQKQRIGIARALYSNPRLLLLDEATSALDHETEAAFVEALESLRGKLTMIVVAHRPAALEKCDHKFYMTP